PRSRRSRRPGAGGPGFAGFGDFGHGIGGAVWFHHNPDDRLAQPEASETPSAPQPRSSNLPNGRDEPEAPEDIDLDKPLYLTGPPDDEGEPVYVVADEITTIDEEDSDEPVYIVSIAAILSEYPLLRDIPAMGELRYLGGAEGKAMPPEVAVALRDAAVRHGQRFAGTYNDVYLLGDFAIRVPKQGPDVLDFVLWPKEYRTLQALAHAGVRGVPRVLHVELDEQGEVIFEIQRRIHGRPVAKLGDRQVFSFVEAIRRQLGEVPIPQELLPLPSWYPASGDSAGFFRMLTDKLERDYQRYRSKEPYRSVFDNLGFGASLTAKLEDEIPFVRSQPFHFIHADLTAGNVLETDQGVQLVDFGLALYGPEDYEITVIDHRNPGEPSSADRLPPHLRPWQHLLDTYRVFIDLVRLVEEACSPTVDDRRLLDLALNVSWALANASQYGTERGVVSAWYLYRLAWSLLLEAAADRGEELYIVTDSGLDRSDAE
ncbi:aminoglycoside phosphotransferase family protein, partial [Nocardia sp. NPDC019302]|uniref:aminoglycoside phosphotransferase family protein n=1 Tax=Nocardia sp. NPDC019302 TaxID=3154592 RepID=UPI0033CE3273